MSVKNLMARTPSLQKLPIDEKTRFYCLTVGRTGSSLLCAIMADAGANFDMPPPDEWDWDVGEMEHPTVIESENHFRRARAVKPGKAFFILHRYLWDIRMHYAKRALRRILERARFVKACEPDEFVYWAYRMRFTPRIIINYRKFEQFSPSTYLLSGMNLTDQGPRYDRYYRDGLFYAHIFGGCTVSFEELTDLKETRWAKSLSAVTGLDEKALLASRKKRVGTQGRKNKDRPVFDSNDSKTTETYKMVSRFKGKVILPDPGLPIRLARK